MAPSRVCAKGNPHHNLGVGSDAREMVHETLSYGIVSVGVSVVKCVNDKNMYVIHRHVFALC